MQACGDYVIVPVTHQKIYFYVIYDGELHRLDHLTIDNTGGVAGMVYHKNDDRYYVVAGSAADYNAEDKYKLYKSTSNDLMDPSCSFPLVIDGDTEKSFRGAASSTGLLALWTSLIDDPVVGENNSLNVTDHLALSKIDVENKKVTKVKEISSGLRRVPVLTSASFRWGSAFEIKGGELYVVGPSRSLSSDYKLKYYKTR